MQADSQSNSELPFAMQFATMPTAEDLLEANAATITSSYSTDCGPTSSPDDGQTVSHDD